MQGKVGEVGAVISDEVAEIPEVASHDGWAKLGLHVGGHNGMERVEGGSGKELHPRVLSLYG